MATSYIFQIMIQCILRANSGHKYRNCKSLDFFHTTPKFQMLYKIKHTSAHYAIIRLNIDPKIDPLQWGRHHALYQEVQGKFTEWIFPFQYILNILKYWCLKIIFKYDVVVGSGGGEGRWRPNWRARPGLRTTKWLVQTVQSVVKVGLRLKLVLPY